MDGLNWDLLNDGIGNPKNCKSLLFAHETPPAMVSGIRGSAEVAVRAGFKHIQFSEISEENAKCVDAYLRALQPLPSPWLVNGSLSKNAVKGKSIFEREGCAECHSGMYYTDLKTYLPGDILVKVDRMSMANSLEVRAPFLDYRIIEFAASLPSDWKIKGENKKIILRKAFSRLLPAGVLNRAKHGFTVPLDIWFRGDLKPLAEECLFKQNALAEYLSIPTVQRLWQEHQSKSRDHGTILWSLLMLGLWQREYLL